MPHLIDARSHLITASRGFVGARAQTDYKLYTANFATRPDYDTRTRFPLSTDFKREERQVIYDAIEFLAREYRRHFSEHYASDAYTSIYIEKLARSFSKYEPRPGSKERSAADTMSVLALITGQNSRPGDEIRIERLHEEGRTWGRDSARTFIYSYKNKSDLEARLARLRGGRLVIKLNSYNLSRQGDRVNYWASTIFHEILHQCGYRHPTGYEGSLIKEAGLVVARQARRRPDLGLVGGRDFGYSIAE